MPYKSFILGLMLLLLTACQGVEPPLSVSVRRSLLDAGFVFRITNTSDDFLHEIKAVVESPTGEKHSFYRDTLKPHQTLEIGWLELNGWQIPAKSTIKITSKGYLLPVSHGIAQ